MNHIFASARLKLTLWYLLIILCISSLFSFAIYTGIEREFQKFEQFQASIQQERSAGYVVLPGRTLIPIDPDLVNDSRARVILALLSINTGILVLAGISGYFLAGKTLQPIQEMVDEQARFISDASHELRTPLTSLRSEMEVNLRDKKLTLPEAKKIMQSNLEDVVSLQTLSDRLLELTQYGQKNMKDSFGLLKIKKIVEDAMTATEISAQTNHVAVSLRGSDVLVRGDRYALKELFVILLDNAIKFSSDKGKVKVKVYEAVQNVSILIEDEGVGISAKDLPHIFDRFYRSDRSRSVTKGYGLGLAIAKKIVEYHAGSIGVKSKEHKGTTITVTLPKPELKE